jgi:hypothetical protein
MPQLIWLYLTALLYDRTSVSCVALAEALATVSHDRLTRLLRGNWSGQTLLELAIRTLFVWERGYLIIDDTVLAAGCRHGYVGKPASGPVVGRRARGPGDRPIAPTNRGGNLFSPGPRHRSPATGQIARAAGR